MLKKIIFFLFLTIFSINQYSLSFLVLIGKIFKKSLTNPPPLSGINELSVSPSNLPNKKITSGTRSDSHLLGQDSEVYSEHSSGGSLGSFSFGEDSTTIANTQQGIVGKVLLDDVAESNSRKSSEDASEKQLQPGNKKTFKFVVHDYEVSSPEWDANASKFFSRWGFAKYGRKKGCHRCKDLYEKGSSSQKHAFTCPSITGVQESSTSSDEIDEDLSRNEVINDAWNFFR
jgi:hypothetical protein